MFQGTWKALKPAVDFGKTASSGSEGESLYTHIGFGLKIAAEMQTAREWPNLFLSLHCRSRTLPVLGHSYTKLSHKRAAQILVVGGGAPTAPLLGTEGATVHDLGHSHLCSDWAPVRGGQGRCWITVCCPQPGELKPNSSNASAGISKAESFLPCAPRCIPSRARPLCSSS